MGIKPSSFNAIRRECRAAANTQKAAILQRFFKTGPGEYGHGDRFLGIVVPVIRAIAKEHSSAALPVVWRLLASPWHEERLVALCIMTLQFKKGDLVSRKAIFQAYLANTRNINNWDLVDLSAPNIVGAYLQDDPRRRILYILARSRNLWERRISILATFYFIRQGDFREAFAIATILLQDREDLIHKAVGWMLREIGKRDLRAEESFLRVRYRAMPRTMLRYAIERFPEPRRQKYLRGKA